MFERFTERAIRIIMAAQEEARRLRHNFVGTEHLLLGMLKEKDPVVLKTIEALGIDPKVVKQKTEEAAHKRGMLDIEGEVPFTSDVKKSIELAWDEARQLGHSHVGVEHLFLGLIRESSGVAARILSSLGVSISTAKNKIIGILGEETAVAAARPGIGAPANTPILDSFSRDLTAYAKLQKLDPVVGRAKEIERVTQILSRRTKNNPVLTGDAGVGKTAIVEGLAQRIVSGNVPPPLMDRRVVTLDLGLMVAGTKYRGEFEERMKKLLEEVRKAGKIILFIDELHTLIGAGGAEGALDAANILKPALARGEIQCIGATTIEEYRKHIEEDAALERRFQSVMISEPTIEETIEILKGLRPRYEDFHKVKITDEALGFAARLSARYISDRHLPDKAIDLVDEAASRVMLRSFATPPELENLTKELEKVRQEKESAVARQDPEKAAALRGREDALRAEREEALVRYREEGRETGAAVTPEEIAQVVSAWTGVPVAQMTEKETERLLKMEEELKRKVVGQAEAVAAVARSIRRSRAGLKDPKRPIGSFIFLGPSGVGKTHLARKLAEFLFGDPEATVRIDMSEYLEGHTVSRLVGSPPGYVGYGEGGQLSEPVRRRPNSIVLLDEIEKAHPDVLNILLQILEDGRLTDAKGNVIDFKNTVVIMTSNVGAKLIQKESSYGFITKDDQRAGYERMREQVLAELKKEFKPEFLNRVDETVVFRSLTKDDIKHIQEIMIDEVNERLKDKGLKIKISAKAKDAITDKGFDPQHGARPLRHAIQEMIEDTLSDEVLKGKFAEGATIHVGFEDGKITFHERDKKKELATAGKK